MLLLYIYILSVIHSVHMAMLVRFIQAVYRSCHMYAMYEIEKDVQK